MKAHEVMEVLGISRPTLFKYVKNGLIHRKMLNSKSSIYDADSVYALATSRKIDAGESRVVVTYSRVSLSKQKNDLKSQTSRLYDFSISRGYSISEQIEDIRSGMSFGDRKGFSRLLDMVMQGKVSTIVVENRDRLCRFGYDLFEMLCARHNTEIVVASESIDRTYEQELTEDLVSIIHHFSMKSYSHRRKINKLRILAENAVKSEDLSEMDE